MSVQIFDLKSSSLKEAYASGELSKHSPIFILPTEEGIGTAPSGTPSVRGAVAVLESENTIKLFPQTIWVSSRAVSEQMPVANGVRLMSVRAAHEKAQSSWVGAPLHEEDVSYATAALSDTLRSRLQQIVDDDDSAKPFTTNRVDR